MEPADLLTDGARLAAIRDYVDRRIAQVLVDLAREIGVGVGARNPHILRSAEAGLVELAPFWTAVHPDLPMDFGPSGLSFIPDVDYVLGVARVGELLDRALASGEAVSPEVSERLTELVGRAAPPGDIGYYARAALDKILARVEDLRSRPISQEP